MSRERECKKCQSVGIFIDDDKLAKACYCTEGRIVWAAWAANDDKYKYFKDPKRFIRPDPF